MTTADETRLLGCDVAEMAALALLPTVLVAGFVVLATGPENFVGGLVVGGMGGAFAASLRRGFYAVRTDDGIERRVREAPEENAWTRLAAVDYDETWDRPLAAGLLVVGLAGFAAVPLLNPDGMFTIRLVTVGLIGVVAGLLVVGVSHSKTGSESA